MRYTSIPFIMTCPTIRPLRGTLLKIAGRGALLVGTRRVGATVARRLSAENMPLAICYRSAVKEARLLQTEIEAVGGHVILLQGDMSVETDVQRVVSAAAEGLGGLWFTVNLASDFKAAPFHALDGQSWDRAMASAKASYLIALHGSRVMMRNEGITRGHVVLFSDWAAGQTPYKGYLPYLTAKAATDFMTRCFAAELAPHGILVNAIAPGPTLRPPDLSEQVWERDVLARTPLKRESSLEDIAEMVATLLKSETITGETIRVDSGRHLAGPGIED